MNLLVVLMSLLATTTNLDKGAEALDAFEVEEAIHYLELAEDDGPYAYDDYLHLYEKLGIAYIYLGRKDLALEAFAMLLTLDPAYAISYTLSPKVTFVFEEAKKQSADFSPPAIYFSWANNQKVDQPIHISLHVASDPRGYLVSAKLHTRVAGRKTFRTTDVSLPGVGGTTQVELPAVAPESQEPKTLQLYLSAYDDKGNQVYFQGNEKTPRKISLGVDPVVPWYKKWWVWAVVGGAIAVGTGVTVYMATEEPAGTVGGTFK